MIFCATHLEEIFLHDMTSAFFNFISSMKRISNEVSFAQRGVSSAHESSDKEDVKEDVFALRGRNYHPHSHSNPLKGMQFYKTMKLLE
jgi:hypothetical protein